MPKADGSPTRWEQFKSLFGGDEEDTPLAAQDPKTGFQYLQGISLDRKSIVENDPDVVAMRQRLTALEAEKNTALQADLDRRFEAIVGRGLFTKAEAPAHKEKFMSAPDVYEFAVALAKPLPQFAPKPNTVDAKKVADEFAASMPGQEDPEAMYAREREEAAAWAKSQNGGKS